MRRSYLFLLLAIAAVSPCPAADDRAAEQPAAAPENPNIIFILADDLRFDMLGIAGNDAIHTPNLDKLAQSGIYFSQATVHVPQCCPARAVVITGLTPFQSGYTSMDIQAPGAGERDSFTRFPTLPSILADSGYNTVLVGKWHINPDPWLSGFTTTRLWFPGGMCGYENPMLCEGETREAKLIPGNITEIFADDAIAFLESPDARAKPFFLWVAPTAPHEPCGPTPQRIDSQYEDKTSRDLVREGIQLGNSPRWDDMWVPYFQAVTHLDEQVGRILTSIESSEHARNTIIIFTSDSGIMMGRRGIDTKVAPFEDSIRIPVIISAPWLQPRTSTAPISDLDLPPTILSMLGLQGATPSTWRGRDLSKLLTAGDHAVDDTTGFTISLWDENRSPNWGKWANRTIRTPHHKLIVWQDERRPDEYYNLGEDPHEERNLIAESASSDPIASLKNRLRKWMQTAEDPALNWSKFN